MQPEMTTDDIGTKRWYLNNQLHREDGPAVIWLDNGTAWYLHGQLHRVDGPAVSGPDDGYEAWYIGGLLHRVERPAVIQADGSERWYLHSKLHREDGPAVIWPSGIVGWYLNGKELTEDEVWAIKFKKQVDEAVDNAA